MNNVKKKQADELLTRSISPFSYVLHVIASLKGVSSASSTSVIGSGVCLTTLIGLIRKGFLTVEGMGSSSECSSSKQEKSLEGYKQCTPLTHPSHPFWPVSSLVALVCAWAPRPIWPPSLACLVSSSAPRRTQIQMGPSWLKTLICVSVWSLWVGP
ncbi:hypothetical protein PGT21_050012 [Puccinia graminis f. sp. tritici]|uniref:Uncharacterized protein n=1 Tax=Puccinia graminis f. sp. tritici TaxID=56615 RepID=A0A5B0R5X8_PUCGR|nr:hypothetical protein PGT21_050012 [Puccinia graminis f. sp. tritici]KAA1120673.1 hypothetical protein PGTUg99_050080 [Puccinia graminis f. sp. tritici]